MGYFYSPTPRKKSLTVQLEMLLLISIIGIRKTFKCSRNWDLKLSDGKVSKGVNPEGIKFYNNVFNKLISNGITPFVTLFHWDTPQALENEYGGFMSSQIAFCGHLLQRIW